MSDRTTKHCDVCLCEIDQHASYVTVTSMRVTTSVTLDVCNAVCLSRVSFDWITGRTTREAEVLR
jgi:hypothetical protein